MGRAWRRALNQTSSAARRAATQYIFVHRELDTLHPHDSSCIGKLTCALQPNIDTRKSQLCFRWSTRPLKQRRSQHLPLLRQTGAHDHLPDQAASPPPPLLLLLKPLPTICSTSRHRQSVVHPPPTTRPHIRRRGQHSAVTGGTAVVCAERGAEDEHGQG